MTPLPRKLTDRDLADVRHEAGVIQFRGDHEPAPPGWGTKGKWRETQHARANVLRRVADRAAALEALLGEVAAESPWRRGHPGESDYCTFCWGYDHKTDCLFVRLRAAVEG